MEVLPAMKLSEYWLPALGIYLIIGTLIGLVISYAGNNFAWVYIGIAIGVIVWFFHQITSYVEEKVIVVSGYFDPLHIGHIEYFKLAKGLGTKLIVILNNDIQAKLKKGKSFMPLKERKQIIESIKYVDEVIISKDKDLTVCKTLKSINPTPHIFAKGGDRFSYEIPEKQICNEKGITIVDGLGKKIQSSSNFYKGGKRR